MGDRIPIGTIPGLTSQLANFDILIGTLGVGCVVSRVFVRHTDYDDGGATNTSIAGSIRNATGGGGSGISFTIANQTQAGVATGSLSVASGGSIYLRLSTGSASQNLTGWIEVEGAAGIVTALTNLARVKEFLGISGSADDALLTNLINAVSGEIQGAIGRQIIQATVTGERLGNIGEPELALNNAPIISVTSITEDGAALTVDVDFESKASDKAAGILVRLSGGLVASWSRGTGHIRATYDHGYATVPEAVVQAATELVCFDYFQSEPGGKRLGLGGTILPAGGESTYTRREDLWRAQKPRLRAYTSVWL